MDKSVEVHDQGELDEAFSNPTISQIYVVGSPDLKVTAGGAIVHVGDNSITRASGIATIMARGTAAVYADDDVLVLAKDNVVVMVRNRARIWAEGTVAVYARDTAGVSLDEDATAVAAGDAWVMAKGRSVVHAHGRVSAYADEDARVYKHSPGVTAWGTNIIDHSNDPMEVSD